MAIGASPAPERHAPIDLDLLSEAESSIAAPAPKPRLAPKHRIALPKHEGSRRRRRWENGIHPSHPRPHPIPHPS